MKSNWGRTLSIFLLLVYFLPFILLGEDAYVVIHDNLENELIYIKQIIGSGYWFTLNPEAIIPQPLGGINRNFLRSGINITFIFFYFFKPYVANLINFIMVHTVGFIGMYLFSRTYFFRESKNTNLSYLFAVSYALIPYGTTFCGIAISGIPLLVYAFLQLQHQRQFFLSLCIIALYALGSSIVIIAPFLLFLLMGIAIFLFWYHGWISRQYILGICFLILLFTAIEFPFLQFLWLENRPTSHRSDYDPSKLVEYYAMKNVAIDTVSSLWRSIGVFFNGRWHAGNFITITTFGFVTTVSIWGRLPKKANILLLSTILLIVVGSLLYGFYGKIYLLINLGHERLQQYNWNRLYFLFPLLWYMALGISIRFTKKEVFKKVGLIATILQLGFIIAANVLPKKGIEWRTNMERLINPSEKFVEPSWRQYYSTKLYADIRTFIAKSPDSYRVASIGIDPAIALYNGFCTVDGYHNNYDVLYKSKFMKPWAA